jgi:hypothetical protein
MADITTKFQSYVLSATTLITFTVWHNYNDYMHISPYLIIISGSLISLGLYQFVAAIFLLVFKRIKLVRKFFLGPRYLEGNWVGFYIGLSGHVRFIVEHFEQDFESLIVRGSSFDDQKQFHTSWISYPANIDVAKGELTYMYELKGIKEVSNGTGITYFSFFRKDQSKPPTMIKGFSADLHNNGFRTKAFEVKLKDSKKPITEGDALNEAIKFYHANKDSF